MLGRVPPYIDLFNFTDMAASNQFYRVMIMVNSILSFKVTESVVSLHLL